MNNRLGEGGYGPVYKVIVINYELLGMLISNCHDYQKTELTDKY